MCVCVVVRQGSDSVNCASSASRMLVSSNVPKTVRDAFSCHLPHLHIRNGYDTVPSVS